MSEKRDSIWSRLYRGTTTFDFVGRRRIGFIATAVAIAVSLISLFTHIHLFWVAGLILALIDFPDFTTPLQRIARGVESLAHIERPPEHERMPESELLRFEDDKKA